MTSRMHSSYTMWNLFRNCRKAADWRYVKHVVPLERDPVLQFGSLVHECLETWHGTRDLAATLAHIDRACPNRAFDAEQRRTWHIATAMMKGYVARYPTEDFEVVALEKPFEGEIVNPNTGAASRSFVLGGKVDGIVKVGEEHFLLEHKCVTGSSRIYDHTTGELLRVDEMAVRGIAPRVLSIDQSGQLKIADAQVPRPAGVRQVFRVAMRSGRQLAVSENHPILTNRGWVEAAALKEGDWVAVPRTTATRRDETPFSDAEVKLIGYLLGDGTFSKLIFSKSEGSVVEDFIQTAEHLKIRYRIDRPRDRPPSVVLSDAPGSPARLFLERLGLHGDLTAEHKHVPEALYAITDSQIALLVGALWSTDGCVNVFDEKRPDCSRVQKKVLIAYVSRSHALCCDVQRLLLRLGINTSVTRSSVKYQGHRRAVFTTKVVGRGSKRKFLQLAVNSTIPILKYPETLRDALDKVKHGEDPRTSPKDVPNWLERAEVFWDRVDVVLVSGRAMMYDLTVPGIHTFVVDDVITHNTSATVDSAYLERLWTDFQITIYSHYVEKDLGIKISGVIYNILVKARLQQAAGESEEEFAARSSELVAKSKTGRTSAKRREPESDEDFQSRLLEKYADPPMFHRETIYISRDRFELLQSELWELTQAFLDARRRDVFYQNTDHCFRYGKPCPYYALCRSDGNPAVLENFYRRLGAPEEPAAEESPDTVSLPVF